MADVQVTCITKPHPQSPHEHITELGNPKAGWKWSRDRVIASIDAKTNTFFVVDPYTGKRSNVGVVRPAGRAAYLRTHADGDWNDGLRERRRGKAYGLVFRENCNYGMIRNLVGLSPTVCRGRCSRRSQSPAGLILLLVIRSCEWAAVAKVICALMGGVLLRRATPRAETNGGMHML